MGNKQSDLFKNQYPADPYEGTEGHESFMRAILLEERAEEDARIPPEDIPGQAQGETAERALLKRDIRKAAIARMEAAARTQADFEEVVLAWDREDANRERRERYHEIGRDDAEVPFEYNMSPDGAIIPAPIHHVYWRQVMKGDFLDLIFDCPYDLHELATDGGISHILDSLCERHKELFFYLAIRGYGTAHTARIFGQTDRNIRQVRATVKKRIREKLLPMLRDRERKGEPLTLQERDYLKRHCKDAGQMI